MTRRPRGTCHVCRHQWRGRWVGDVLVLTGHPLPLRRRSGDPSELCPGSGTPAVFEGGSAPAA